jgi:hypothetical protein
MDDLLELYPMVEMLILDIRQDTRSSTSEVVRWIKQRFDRQGPYVFARDWGLLVNNSGEEFAVQFMSFYNNYSCSQAY